MVKQTITIGWLVSLISLILGCDVGLKLACVNCIVSDLDVQVETVKEEGVARIEFSLVDETDEVVAFKWHLEGQTAVKGLDFEDLGPKELLFERGQRVAVITVPILGDALDEDDETFTLVINAVENANLATTRILVKIQDDDDSPEVIFSNTIIEVFENQPFVDIPVSLSAISGRKITVPLTIEGDATEGLDYTLDNYQVTFDPGELTKNIRLQIVNDTKSETTKELLVKLLPSQQSNITANAQATVILLDDDTPEISITSDTNEIAEKDGRSILTLTIPHPFGLDLLAPIKISGSATNNEDYQFVSAGTDDNLQTLINTINGDTALLTIPTGATTLEIQIASLDDRIYDPQEQIVFAVTNHQAEALEGLPALDNANNDSKAETSQYSITIVDDETPEYLSIETKEDGTGTALSQVELIAGQPATLFAIARNKQHDFLFNIPVTWTLSSFLGDLSSRLGNNTTYQARKAGQETLSIAHEIFNASNVVTVTVLAGPAEKLGIMNAGNQSASEFQDHVMSAGEKIELFAATVDAFGNFVESQTGFWVINSLAQGGQATGTLSQLEGTSTVFTADKVGKIKVNVNHISLPSDETGIITVDIGYAKHFTWQYAPLVQNAVQLKAGECSAKVTLQTVDEEKTPSNTKEDVLVSLVGLSQASLYQDASCNQPQASVIVKKGTSSSTFYFKDTKAETLAISASAPSFTTDSLAVTISPEQAFQFFIADPADSIVNTAINIAVEARDMYDNRVYTYQKDVTLTADGSATGSGIVNIQNGLGNILINDIVAEVVNLALSSPSDSFMQVSHTENLTFLAAGASRYVILDPLNTNAGLSATITIQAQDIFGNLVPGYSGSVTLTTDGDATGAGIVNLSGGIGTISISDSTAETVNLALSNPGGGITDITSTENIIFAPGGATTIVITNPTDVIVGNTVTVTVNALDALGNLAAAHQTDIDLITDSGTATGAGTIDIVNGVGQITISDTTTGTVNLSLANDQGAVPDITSIQDVLFLPDSASKYIIVNPSDVPVGTNATITVKAMDALDNLDTNYVGTVTLLTDGAATGAGIVNVTSGVGTIQISDTTAQTVNLSLSNPTGGIADATSIQDNYIYSWPCSPNSYP